MDKITTIKCGSVNCFVISGEKGSILVDVGVKKYRKKIVKELKKYNIKLIILTHGHIDHIGNAKFLSEYLGVSIAMGRNDYELSKNNLCRPLFHESSLLGIILYKLSIREFKKIEIESFITDIFLEDSDSLLEYGVNAKVISLPGHTVGSLGILVEGKDLIIGDTIINIIKPQRTVLAEDFQKLTESIEKVRLLKVNKIYTGHGNTISAGKLFRELRK